MQTFHVNVAELVSEIQHRQRWTAGEITRRNARLNGLPPASPERDQLRQEICIYSALDDELQSLLTLATGQEPGAARQCRSRNPKQHLCNVFPRHSI